MATETLVIEAVSTKPKYPKFNSGAILAGGTWINVAKNVPIQLFTKDSQVEVETETNDKGYKSVVGVVGTENKKPKPKKVETKTETKTETLGTTQKTVTTNNYETDKNRRIQVQGILQGVVQSPATINFGDDVNVIAEKVLALTDLLIAGMDARV